MKKQISFKEFLILFASFSVSSLVFQNWDIVKAFIASLIW